MKVESLINQMGYNLIDYERKGKKKFATVINEQGTIYVSGHAAKFNDELLFPGIVGDNVSVSEAKEAMVCALFNCLVAIKSEVGDLDKIKTFLNVKCYVAITEDLYEELSEISNSLTEKLYEIFGENGNHTRTTVGVKVLPGNTSVEVEMTLKLKEEN